MSILNANATANLSANGTSVSNGTLTWTRPNIPTGSTINSITVSGMYTWNGKGNVTVTINGKNCVSGGSFNVALPVSVTSPYTISCTGGNKNATGNSFTWSNLVVTYDYTEPLVYYNVSVGSVQNGTVTVSPSGSVVAGTTVKITATPNAGYLIDSYFVNGSKIGGTSFVVSADSVVTVTFKEKPPQKIYYKVGSVWHPASKVYKKVSGAWVIQNDLTGVFATGVKYVKGNTSNPSGDYKVTIKLIYGVNYSASSVEILLNGVSRGNLVTTRGGVEPDPLVLYANAGDTIVVQLISGNAGYISCTGTAFSGIDASTLERFSATVVGSGEIVFST